MLLRALNPYVIGGIGAAVVGAYMLGNLHATQRAVDTAYDRSAREMAAATGAVIAFRKTEKTADAKTHETLTANLRIARRDRDAARDALAKEKANARTPDCVFSPDVRRVLDAASGAADANGVAGNTAGRTDATAAEGTPLTCDELADGYLALADHDRSVVAQLEALQDFLNEVNK